MRCVKSLHDMSSVPGQREVKTLIMRIVKALPTGPTLLLWGDEPLGHPVHYKSSVGTTNPLIHRLLLAFPVPSGGVH